MTRRGRSSGPHLQFGEHLHRVREAAMQSIEAFAQDAGVTPRLVWDIECCNILPTVSVYDAAVAAYPVLNQYPRPAATVPRGYALPRNVREDRLRMAVLLRHLRWMQLGKKNRERVRAIVRLFLTGAYTIEDLEYVWGSDDEGI